jgi:TfoX/Sxy family transcriptional regulator of competence genes
MSMPRTDDKMKQFFAAVMPGDPHIHIHPMFGNLAGFINGNMFVGLYGQQIFVRLPEDERTRLMEQEGAALFSPMPGKPMKEYVTLPEEWRDEPGKITAWIEQSLQWAGAMPEKVPAKKPTAKKKKSKGM